MACTTMIFCTLHFMKAVFSFESKKRNVDITGRETEFVWLESPHSKNPDVDTVT